MAPARRPRAMRYLSRAPAPAMWEKPAWILRNPPHEYKRPPAPFFLVSLARRPILSPSFSPSDSMTQSARKQVRGLHQGDVPNAQIEDILHLAMLSQVTGLDGVLQSWEARPPPIPPPPKSLLTSLPKQPWEEVAILSAWPCPSALWRQGYDQLGPPYPSCRKGRWSLGSGTVMNARTLRPLRCPHGGAFGLLSR